MRKENKFDGIDLSEYSKLLTRPKLAYAKRLIKKKQYTITVNGLVQIVIGHPGNLDVYECGYDGKILHNMPYDEETFKRKFDTTDVQQELKITNKDD